VTFPNPHFSLQNLTSHRQQGYGVSYDNVRLELLFFEFTTGEPHPLSSTHTVLLPPIFSFEFAHVKTEVLGDHILLSVRRRTGQASFYLVSWKIGTVTHVSGLRLVSHHNSQAQTKSLKLRSLSDSWTPLWGGAPKLAVIDNNLIALIKDSANSLEICKLEVTASSGPRLRTMCFLDLPPLTSEASCVLSIAVEEWVPTSKHHARSSSSRKHHIPFYSSTVGTITFLLDYRTYFKGVGRPFRCTITISVAAILSVIRATNGVCHVPWKDWGPSGTRIFELETNSLISVGPFWIMDLSPLAVRDYDLLRTRCTQSTTEDTSSSHPQPPVSSSTEVFGEHWEGGSVETHLPYRDVVANDLDFGDFPWIMGDREWIVGIKALVRPFLFCGPISRSESDHASAAALLQEEGTSVTVYHVG
jgi:hypothetical protein